MTYQWGVDTYDSKEECVAAIVDFVYNELSDAYICDLTYVTDEEDREFAAQIGITLEEIES